MNGGKTRGEREGGGSRGGGQRESSKWFQGAGPTCRERGGSRMVWYTEGLERIHQLTHMYTWMYSAFIGISSLCLCNFITTNKTETTAAGTYNIYFMNSGNVFMSASL